MSIELKVPVYNINKGMNAELFNRSEKLRHYAEFIAKKRELLELHADYEQAVKEAVDYCIDNGILADFLKEHGGRVVSILATEFRLSDAAKVWKKEGIEEGLAQGLEAGRVQGIEAGRVQGIEVGRVQGIEVGRLEGRAETQLEIARELLSTNLTVQDIIKATGLSAEQVVSLGHQQRP